MTPNKLKFASLARKLDPASESYVEDVMKLSGEYESRKTLIRQLIDDYTTGEVEDKAYATLNDFALTNKLDDAIRAAIERFVVDEQ